MEEKTEVRKVQYQIAVLHRAAVSVGKWSDPVPENGEEIKAVEESLQSLLMANEKPEGLKLTLRDGTQAYIPGPALQQSIVKFSTQYWSPLLVNPNDIEPRAPRPELSVEPTDL